MFFSRANLCYDCVNIARPWLFTEATIGWLNRTLNHPLFAFLELTDVPVGPCLGFYVLDPVQRARLDEERPVVGFLHLTLFFLLIWTIISTWSVVFDEVKIYVLGHCVKIYAFKNSSWCQISHLILLFNNWMMSTAILLYLFTCGHINSYFYCFFTVGYNFKSKWLWVF